jgi:histidyl-tRNA synthetase
MYKAKPKLQPQFNSCDKEHIPLSVIIGKSEIEQGVVKIKDMTHKDESGGGGEVIQRQDMVKEIRKRLSR